MSDSADFNEVVMFISGDPNQESVIVKEMMYTEFEAVLDGVVGLDDCAGRTLKAAFLVVNPRLQATACALFLIKFDKNGNADRTWNMPLRHLAETGGIGPDMGGGPIRLSCRSQCSVAWHHGSMWDPDMSPSANTFVALRDALTRNRLCLIVSNTVTEPPNWEVKDYSRSLPGGPDPYGVNQNYAAAAYYAAYQHSINSQRPASSGQAQFDSLQPGFIQPGPMMNPGQYPSPMGSHPQLVDNRFSDQELQHRWKKLETQQRNKIANLLKAQRLHITTLETKREEQVAQLKFDFEQEKTEFESEIAQLRLQVESLHKQNMAIREQSEAQRAQIDAMGGASVMQLLEVEEHSRAEIEALTDRYERILGERVNEESAKLKEEIQLRDMELMHRHEVTKQLREELMLLRKDKIRLVNAGADRFLERLENLGINFIAFHPGAGHISVPLADMSQYIENPVAYAARKCLVTEEDYRHWLVHYQSPQCNARFSDKQCCGARIQRTDVPSKYVPGESDRCSKHRLGGENVVNFAK